MKDRARRQVRTGSQVKPGRKAVAINMGWVLCGQEIDADKHLRFPSTFTDSVVRCQTLFSAFWESMCIKLSWVIRPGIGTRS